jgi:predicted nucleic acid-binding protein
VRTVFADTLYWIAAINPKDQWHQRAIAASQALGQAHIVTIDEILVETLNYFAERGGRLRRTAAQAARAILAGANVEVVAQRRETFLFGLALYEVRADKGYSLTDCIAMSTMRERGISEALTHDHHFAQEGFGVLL